MDNTHPLSVPDLINRFGGNAAFAAVIGKAPSTASEMKRRGSIPVDYWPAVISAAADKGISGVTAEWLMWAHAPAEAAE